MVVLDTRGLANNLGRIEEVQGEEEIICTNYCTSVEYTAFGRSILDSVVLKILSRTRKNVQNRTIECIVFEDVTVPISPAIFFH